MVLPKATSDVERAHVAHTLDSLTKGLGKDPMADRISFIPGVPLPLVKAIIDEAIVLMAIINLVSRLVRL